MFLDGSREFLGHLSVAMRRHRQWCARQGVPVPDEWVEFGALVTARATEGQAGTSLERLWELTEGRVIEPMLLTYEEVATAMGCSTRHVKRLAADGSLPTVAVGSLMRVRVADLDAYVEGLPVKREAS